MLGSSSGESLIVYPRSYNLRGGADRHSIAGVTADGTEVNVKLRLDPKILEQVDGNEDAMRRLPQVSEFARKDREAESACIATPDNAPGSRSGVLLFSRVAPDPASKKPNRFLAGWAVVLCEDARSPDPVIGLGRMDIEERGGKRMFRGLLYDVEAMRRFGPSEGAELRRSLVDAVDARTRRGRVGGALLCARDARGELRWHLERFPAWRRDAQRLQNGDELAGELWTTLAGQLEACDTLTLVPIERYNCGPRGNRFHSEPRVLSPLRKTFYNNAGLPRVSRIAMRVWVSPEEDNTLLSRIYPTSPPMWMPEDLTEASQAFAIGQAESAPLGVAEGAGMKVVDFESPPQGVATEAPESTREHTESPAPARKASGTQERPAPPAPVAPPRERVLDEAHSKPEPPEPSRPAAAGQGGMAAFVMARLRQAENAGPGG